MPESSAHSKIETSLAVASGQHDSRHLFLNSCARENMCGNALVLLRAENWLLDFFLLHPFRITTVFF